MGQMLPHDFTKCGRCFYIAFMVWYMMEFIAGYVWLNVWGGGGGGRGVRGESDDKRLGTMT